MNSIGSEQERQGRRERERGSSSGLVTLIAALVLLAVNERRLREMPSVGTAVFVGVPLLLLFLYAWKVERGIRDLESLVELQLAVDESQGARRAHLVWYEYVIAKKVALGAYAGERPAVFKGDVHSAVERLGMTTRTNVRHTVRLFAAMWALSVASGVWLARGDMQMALAGSVLLGGATAFGTGIVALIMWWNSRGPKARLGRRIDDASGLPHGHRWVALLEIAHDEIALESPHS